MKGKASPLPVINFILLIMTFNGNALQSNPLLDNLSSAKEKISFCQKEASLFFSKKTLFSHSSFLYLAQDIILGTTQLLSIPLVFIFSLSMQEVAEEYEDSFAYFTSITGKTLSFLLLISAVYTYKRGLQDFRQNQEKISKIQNLVPKKNPVCKKKE